MSTFTVVDARGRPVYWGDQKTWPMPGPGQAVVEGHPPSKDYAWDGRAWFIPPWDADAARAKRWAELQAQRAKMEFAPFQWSGHEIDGDAESQRRLIGASAAILAERVLWLEQCVTALATRLQELSPLVPLNLPTKPNQTIRWTLANNTAMDLTRDEVLTAGLALYTRVAQLFAQSAALRQQVNAANSQAALDAAQWAS